MVLFVVKLQISIIKAFSPLLTVSVEADIKQRERDFVLGYGFNNAAI